MKKSNCLILIVLFLFISVYGQQNKLPPASKSDNWKEFVAEDKSFKILFPKPPEKDISELLTFGGILVGKESKKYLSSSTDEKYFVGFKDFSAPITDDLERRAKYESAFFSLSGHKDVYVQKHLGVEASEDVTDLIEIFGDYRVSAVYRIFIIKQRLFLLAAFLPSQDELSPQERMGYQEKIDKFFNSFTIMEIPPAKYPPNPPLPKDFALTLNGRNFQSRELDLRLQLPTDWKTVIHQPGKSLTSSDEDDESFIEKSATSSFMETTSKRLLFSKSAARISEFWLTVERREFPDSPLYEIAQQKAARIGSKSFKQVISGREFQIIELKYGLDRSSQFTIKRYYTDWKGFILEIGMGYENEADKKIMEDSLKTLTFIKQQ